MLKQLKKLKPKKDTGLDNLPPALLKISANMIAGPLSHLNNLPLNSGTIPQIWKRAHITPLHKSASTPENYKPISILPSLSEVLKKDVHQRLYDFLDEQSLLSNCQFGYREKRSTALVNTILINDIRKEVGKRNLVGTLLLDLSRAFDILIHDTLLTKLSVYGVNNNKLEPTWQQHVVVIS